MKRNTLWCLGVALIAALAGAATMRAFDARESDAPAMSESERKVLYWHDPMIPGWRSDKPGKSPFMDMQLVPVYEGEAPGVVSISPEVTNSLGVRTHAVAPGARLTVPREAVVRTGTRTAIVLAVGNGRFQPVEVVAGPESGDAIEIKSGIKAGDRVVVSGQFLIDAESSLRAGFARMQPAAPASESSP